LQWDAAAKQLLFDGEGPGKGMLCKAFGDFASSLGETAAADTASGVLRDFEMDDESSLDTGAMQAILALVSRMICGIEVHGMPTPPVSLKVN